MMIFFIGYSIDSSCSLFAWQNLHIIICSLTAITGLRSIESRTIQWHCINIYLIWTSGRINTPSAAAIVSRPLIPNIRAMLCTNG